VNDARRKGPFRRAFSRVGPRSYQGYSGTFLVTEFRATFCACHSLGSRGSSREFFERLEDAGVAVIDFHPLNPVAGGNPLNLNVRDHRKILIVDGEVALPAVSTSTATTRAVPEAPIGL
jgi:hypothetical protein